MRPVPTRRNGGGAGGTPWRATADDVQDAKRPCRSSRRPTRRGSRRTAADRQRLGAAVRVNRPLTPPRRRWFSGGASGVRGAVGADDPGSDGDGAGVAVDAELGVDVAQVGLMVASLSNSRTAISRLDRPWASSSRISIFRPCRRGAEGGAALPVARSRGVEATTPPSRAESGRQVGQGQPQAALHPLHHLVPAHLQPEPRRRGVAEDGHRQRRPHGQLQGRHAHQLQVLDSSVDSCAAHDEGRRASSRFSGGALRLVARCLHPRRTAPAPEAPIGLQQLIDWAAGRPEPVTQMRRSTPSGTFRPGPAPPPSHAIPLP